MSVPRKANRRRKSEVISNEGLPVIRYKIRNKAAVGNSAAGRWTDIAWICNFT